MTIYSHGPQPQRGPESRLVSSLTHSSQQLFQTQFHLYKTFTLSAVQPSQEINFPHTQKRKIETIENQLLQLNWHPTDTSPEASFPSVLPFSSLYQNCCHQCCTWIGFSHSLICPQHKLTLERTLSFLESILTPTTSSLHWLACILHFSQITLFISSLGTLPIMSPCWSLKCRCFMWFCH